MFWDGIESKYPLKVCWLCGATKGNSGDLSLCFTNVSPGAGWWHTVGRSPPPWQIPPNYSNIRGFDISMIVPDLLHMWNLGVCRDVIGSTLRIILANPMVFNGPSVPIRLMQASASLRLFARQNKYPLRLKRLTRAKLIWKSHAYPGFASSGYDAFVVMKWLEALISPYTDVYKEIATLIWCSNQAISLMYSAERFLTPTEKENLEVLGSTFLSTYMFLAKNAIDELKFLWRVRPKHHMMSHVFTSQRWINQSFYSTWMDEDFLKKIGKVLGLTSVRTAQKRILQRWCLSIPKNLEKSLSKTSP